MSIATRIEAIEQHLTDDYSVLEVAGADLTNVDKNIVNLKLTWQERLLYFINNGTDVVWNNWEKVTGEGETLTLNSTEEAPMKIDLKGNTSQETTTGKNLFAGGDTTTTNGITFTKHSDGSYDIVGTATSPAYILNYVPLAESGIVNGETYTISTNQNITGLEIRIESYNGNTWLRATLGGLITFPKTHSADVTGATSVRFGLFVNSGTTINLKNLKIQLEKGSSVTSFEPYTGGIPAPSPDYPQDIHVVSGDNSINVCGKNLISTNINDLEQGTISGSNGTNSSANNRVRNNKFFVFDYDNIQPNYVWQIPSGYKNALRVYDKDKNFVGTIENSGFINYLPQNYVGLGIKYVKLVYAKTDDSNITPNDIANLEFMISKGNDATYEPYQNQSYPISLGVENLFDKDNANYVNGWIDGTTMRLNTINGNRMFYMPCKPNTTYTISRSVITSSFRTITYNSTPFPTVTSSNVDYTVGSVLKNDNGTTLTITTNANAKYLVVHYGKIEDTNLNESLATIQVEYGSKQNSYTPYGTTPIELCKIGDYQDSIKKSTGKNLFDKNSIEEGKRLGSDGLPFTDTSFDLSDYIKVDSNTQYTYSRGSNGSGSSAIAYYDSSKTFISRTMPIMDSNAREVVLTTPNNATYVRIADLKTTLDSMQFEKGSSSSSYEPYGKVWYLNKQIGKVVFDGSENWNYQSQYPRFQLTSLSPVPLNNSNLFCSHYIKGQTADTDYVCSLASGTGYSQFLVHDERYTTKEAYNTWLSSNNVSVYYVLKTPTYTEITDNTLLSQLEAFYNAKSKNSQTNITQENNDLPFILDVTALKQITQ